MYTYIWWSGTYSFKKVNMHVFFHRPGVLKDPQIMSGVWLVIFYIVCIILARQVCGSSTSFSFFCQNKHFFFLRPSDYAHLKINELTITMFLGLFFFLYFIIYSMCPILPLRTSWVAVWTSCWIVASRQRERRWRLWRTSTGCFYRMCCHFTWPLSS